MDDYRDFYNDSSEPLGAVSPGGSISGNTEVAGDVDIFAIDLIAGRTYTFDLRGNTLFDAGLILRSADGSALAFGGNIAGSNDDRIIYTATVSGRFYLGAGAFRAQINRLCELARVGHTGPRGPRGGRLSLPA